MHFLFKTLTIALLAKTGLAAPGTTIEARKPVSFPTFSNKTIYVPDANYTDPRVLYARTVELDKGVLLSTWENYSPGM